MTYAIDHADGQPTTWHDTEAAAEAAALAYTRATGARTCVYWDGDDE